MRAPGKGATASLGILESARLTGGLSQAECSLHETLGELAVCCEQASPAAFLAAAALAHAWRARQLVRLLPGAPAGLPDAATLLRSPSQAFDRVLARLRAAASARVDGEAVVEALLASVYPPLLAAYEARLACCSPVADPPLERVLERVMSDLARLTAARGGARSGRALGPGRQLALELAELLSSVPAPFGVMPDLAS